MFSNRARWSVVMVVLLTRLSSQSADLGPEPEPTVATDPVAAWKEAETAIKKFRIAKGFRAELVAAEPQLKNAVAFCFDGRGRIYVSETGRYRSSTFDIRHHMPWYEDDLACRTTDDRVAMIKKRLGAEWPKLQLETETIRFLQDTNGDGRMDVSKVFATGFTNLLDGIASGVMARGSDVWFANIPDLVHLVDRNDDGISDSREVLHHGFGVHFSLTGHDLHGLTLAHDGRIYFTVGDRGANIVTKEGKRLEYPDEGACFRMNPDGTQLEVFATGLRNPQELAFDEFGNLFTGDNDCDHGDRERWVHVVEGSDSGWRIGYQFSEQNPGGAWMSERLWWTNFVGRAAYCLPPLAYIENGPSGICAYPGTGLPEEYRGTFFLTHFKGVDNLSGIRTLKMKPQGAGFAVSDDHELLWNTLPTDVEFSPDGFLHFSDWVHGWPKSERSRIYRLVPDRLDPRAQETAKLLSTGMKRRSVSELVGLLGHPDRRVRLESQFELVARRQIKSLRAAALDAGNVLSRVHAIWGFEQVVRKSSPAERAKALLPIARLMEDPDSEVRGQVARLFGAAGLAEAQAKLAKLLVDPVARVRYQAVMAFHDLVKANPAHVKPPIEELRNRLAGPDGEDPVFRQGAVLLVAELLPSEPRLKAWFEDPSRSVNLALLLAQRRARVPEIGDWIKHPDPLLTLEAARAINDVPIASAWPALARGISRLESTASQMRSMDYPMPAEDREALLIRPLVRRVLNANLREGTEANAQDLARFAQSTSPLLVAYRAEAIGMLGRWAKPNPRDPVVGLWRPLPPRDPAPAKAALGSGMASLLREKSADIAVASAQASAQLQWHSMGQVLLELVQQPTAFPTVRVESLRALAKFRQSAAGDATVVKQWEAALKTAASDSEMQLRKEATRLSVTGNADAAAPDLAKLLQTGSIPEKQAALAALATIPGTVADEIIYGQFRPWVEGQAVPPELQLDILQAAETRSDERIKGFLDKYRAALPKNDLLAPYRIALQGGSAEAGRKVFTERTEAACVRCHRINGEGGDVGPDLTGVGKRYPREYILESIVNPNAKIAQGFESAILTKKDDTIVAGVLKKETAEEIQLNSPEDGLVTVKKSDIQSRGKGMSGMPDGIAQVLSREDLRDLVEFLANLK